MWVQDIEAALRINGGVASLDKIYVTTGTIRYAAGRSLPRTFQEGIRCCLQRSRLFVQVRTGVWKLRGAR